jgi:hypothetical protein
LVLTRHGSSQAAVTGEGGRQIEQLCQRDQEARQHVLPVEVIALAQQAGGTVRSIDNGD